MKGNLGLERVFKLGDFKSMRVSSDVLDIPEELALDKEFMVRMRLLQLIEIDRAFYQYRLQAASMNEFETDQERFDELVGQEAQVFANIKSQIEIIYSTVEE